MIHDYEAEHGNLEALAIAGIVTLAQPCVAGCPAETGGCIRVTMLEPKLSPPFPSSSLLFNQAANVI